MSNTLKKLLMAALVGTCLVSTRYVRGQDQAQPQQQGQPQGNEVLAKLRELREQSNKVQSQLTAIEQKAKEKNPELTKMQNQLGEIYRDKLNEHGYPDEKQLEKLRNMQTQLQTADDMEETERDRLTQEFRKGVMALQQARDQAQQDPEVIKAAEEFDQEKQKTMLEVDKNAATLLQRMEKLQKEIQKLEQQVFQQQ